jgi:hypothetical protein
VISDLNKDLKIAQKLKEHILSRNLSLGATKEGADWCLKALHPSDPLMEVRGIPDESCVPSLMMNYQTVTTVSPGNGATGTWRLDGQLIPNPLAFGAYTYTDSLATRTAEVVNSQITGATHPDRLNQFLSDFRRWRLAYASVTIYQDGPDLANQGTVVVCQKPVVPTKFNLDTAYTSGIGSGYQHAFFMDSIDLPNYDVSQGMPNAYFGRSREGVYIPLKLTRTHQNWRDASCLVYQSNTSQRNTYTNAFTGGKLTLSSSNETDGTGIYPFMSVNDLHMYNVTGAPVGTLTSDFCNDTWADFSFRNMSVSTSLSFFWRFGFEVQCTPGSNMAPHLKLSPPHDELAVQTYFSIARELKDAYPAEFNDLGKIWDVISSIAKKVSPFLGMIPAVGPALAAGVPLVAQAGDSIREALKRTAGPTVGSIASQADKEVAREAISNAQVESARRRIAKAGKAKKRPALLKR